MPPAEKFPLPVHSGDVRVDVQSAIAMLAPAWGFKPLLDISDEEARSNLARASVMVLSYLAQSARGISATPVAESEIEEKIITQPYILIPLAREMCNENWTYKNHGKEWQCLCKEGKH